jgi:hypothetical protein
MDVRSKGSWVIKCSNANESDLRAPPVITPNRNLAFAAPINVVRTIGTRNRDGFQGPTYDPYGRGFDDRIDNKCAACVPLTIRAVAAMHADRSGQQMVANLAAGTTTPKFFSYPIWARFHVCQLRFCGAIYVRVVDRHIILRMRQRLEAKLRI